MKAKIVTQAIQRLLLVRPVDGIIGNITKGAFNRLALCDPEEQFFNETDEGLGHAGETGARDINERASKLIQHFEGCQLKAYKDEVGVWTIGWGHTGLQHKDGTVYAERTITSDKAQQLFHYDMEQFEARVSAFVKVPLTDDQYGALVALDFNTGGLGKSTLLKFLNKQQYVQAADEFLKWTQAGGKVLPGLVRRRRSERRLFLGKEKYLLESMVECRRDERGELD
jgi:lysozyme